MRTTPGAKLRCAWLRSSNLCTYFEAVQQVVCDVQLANKNTWRALLSPELRHEFQNESAELNFEADPCDPPNQARCCVTILLVCATSGLEEETQRGFTMARLTFFSKWLLCK